MHFIFSIFIIFSFSLIGQELFEGYTIFTPQAGNGNSAGTLLLNNDQQTVHSWSHSRGPASMPYLIQGNESGLENAILVYPYRVPNPTMDSGGVGGGVQLVDWDSNVLWDFVLSNEQYQHHHDVQPMPNGNILILAWELKTYQESIQSGRDSNLLEDDMLWPEHIIEINPIGTDSAAIVWEWHLWDHLIQDYDSSKDNYGVISNNPHLLNINYVGPGQNNTNGPADWIHANSIDYNQELDQIVISSKALSEFWIIDHSTTTLEAASSTGGNSGMGGDFLYRWGNPIAYNQGLNEDRLLFGQHDVQWIDAGLPGYGNILLFNNGRNRPEGNFSTIDEISLPLIGFNYTISNSGTFGPLEKEWSYMASDPFDFFADHISGCQRLDNGNTLICDGPQGVFFEVDNIGNTVWEYINPVFGNTIINQGDEPVNDKLPQGVFSNSVFRCSKIDLDFIGLGAVDLSPTSPIEGPPYIYPDICSNLSVDLYAPQIKAFQSIDLLGRLSKESPITIQLFSDGSVQKYFTIK